MGRRGPHPKPAAVKLVAGNPGKRPIQKAPEPVNGEVTCPAWLGSAAKAEWDRLAPELKRLGLLTIVDVDAFAMYCETYAAWSECQRTVQNQGKSYLTAAGRLAERPEVGLANKYLAIAKALAAEFGLTPASRARLSIEEEPDEEDEFARWLDSRKPR